MRNPLIARLLVVFVVLFVIVTLVLGTMPGLSR